MITRKFLALVVLPILLSNYLSAQELYEPVRFSGDHSLVFYPTIPLGTDTTGTVELLFRASPLQISKPPGTGGGGLFGILGQRKPQFSTPSKADLKKQAQEEVIGAYAVFSQADAFGTRFTIYLDETQEHIGWYDGKTLQSVPFNFNDGNYHHVAFSIKAGKMTVVIDGQEKGSFDQAYGPGRRLPLHVGSSDGDLHRFKGEIYMIRMWDAALTAAEIGDESHQVYGAVPESDPNFDHLLLYSEFTESSQKMLLAQDIIYQSKLVGSPGDTVFRHMLEKGQRYVKAFTFTSADNLCVNGMDWVVGETPSTEEMGIVLPPGVGPGGVLDNHDLFTLRPNEPIAGVYATFDEQCIHSIRLTGSQTIGMLRPNRGKPLSGSRMIDIPGLNPFGVQDTLVRIKADPDFLPLTLVVVPGAPPVCLEESAFVLSTTDTLYPIVFDTLIATQLTDIRSRRGGHKFVHENDTLIVQTADHIEDADTLFRLDGTIFPASPVATVKMEDFVPYKITVIPATGWQTTAGEAMTFDDPTSLFLSNGTIFIARRDTVRYTLDGDATSRVLTDGDSFTFTPSGGTAQTLTFSTGVTRQRPFPMNFSELPQQGAQSDFAALPEGAEVIGVEVFATKANQFTGLRLLYKNHPFYELDRLDLGIWRRASDLEPSRDDELARSHQLFDRRDGAVFLHGNYTSNPLYKLWLEQESQDLILAGEVDRRHPTEDTILSIQRAKALGPYRFVTEDGIHYSLDKQKEVTLTFLTPDQYRLVVPEVDTTRFPVKPGVYAYQDFYETSGEDKVQWGGTFSMDQRPRMVEYNFRGYNLAKIDPIDYQVTTGVSSMVFDYPAEDSYNYYYSTVGKIIPYGLTFRNDRVALSRARSHLVSSGKSHQKAWSTNLGLNAGMEGMSFGLSASFSGSTKQMAKTENMYSVAMAHEVKYAIVLDKARMQLSQEFRKAVYDLRDLWLMRGYQAIDHPISGHALTSRNSVELNRTIGDAVVRFSAPDTINTTIFLRPYLQEFIETFGTHYPYAVTYGGMAYQKVEYQDSDLYTENGTAKDISASASGALEGATAGFSVGSGDSKVGSTDDRLKDQYSDVYTVGGDVSFSGDQSSWSLPDHSEVPVFLDLRPISELLSPLYFEDTVIWKQLRPALERELDYYQQLIPRLDESVWNSDTVDFIYEFEIVQIHGDAEEDGGDGEWQGDVAVSHNSAVLQLFQAGGVHLTSDPPLPNFTDYPIPAGTGLGRYFLPPGRTLESTAAITIDVSDIVEVDDYGNSDSLTVNTSHQIAFSSFTENWTTEILETKEFEPGQFTLHSIDDPNILYVTYRYRKVRGTVGLE